MAGTQTQSQTPTPKWCPFGRLSLQQINSAMGRVEGIPSFNQYIMVQGGKILDQNEAYPATYCMGKRCALYDHGHCGLIQERLAPSIYKAMADSTQHLIHINKFCAGMITFALFVLTSALVLSYTFLFAR